MYCVGIQASSWTHFLVPAASSWTHVLVPVCAQCCCNVVADKKRNTWRHITYGICNSQMIDKLRVTYDIWYIEWIMTIQTMRYHLVCSYCSVFFDYFTYDAFNKNNKDTSNTTKPHCIQTMSCQKEGPKWMHIMRIMHVESDLHVFNKYIYIFIYIYIYI